MKLESFLFTTIFIEIISNMGSVNLNEMFLDENYSLETLLTKTQEANLSLSELRDRLIQHQQDLNQTSLELFNNSYDRFYKLSYIISCLAEPIQHLIDPLQNFRNLLGDLCQKHDNYVDGINNKLSALEDTSRNKEYSKRLIALIKRRDRIERQMENIDWSVRAVDRDNRGATEQLAISLTDGIEYKIKCDLLERINIELYHLSSEVKAIQPTHSELVPIKKSLEASLEERQCLMDNWFESSFLEAIETRDKQLVDLIIRTYCQKNSLHRLDAVWRNKVVKPYLNLTITDAQLSQQLSKTHELLDQFIKRQLDLIKAPFVAKSFWSEVVQSFSRVDKIYSLNDFDTFQKRYIATREFLTKQKNFDGLTEVEISQNIDIIVSKFNLKGYFSHRFAQVASSVEASLSSHPLSEIYPPTKEPDPNKPDEPITVQFKLKICMHIYVLVTNCWSPELYIDTLELSFTQLACRIINRFSEWLSKLRLSDFRITGPAAPENNRQTNFLAKQDAIMRLLIEDCARLTQSIKELLEKSDCKDERLKKSRTELIDLSFNELNNGLSNVRSLQRLIER